MAVPTGSVALFLAALSAGPRRPRQRVLGGPRVLVKRSEDIDTFDRVFGWFWLSRARTFGLPW